MTTQKNVASADFSTLPAHEVDSFYMDRLSASEREAREEAYHEGHEAGVEWAKRYATARMLRRLSMQKESHGEHWEINWEIEPGAPNTFADEFVLMVDPPAPDDNLQDASREFWESLLPDEWARGITEEPGFVLGFAEGALFIWNHFLSERRESR